MKTIEEKEKELKQQTQNTDENVNPVLLIAFIAAATIGTILYIIMLYCN